MAAPMTLQPPTVAAAFAPVVDNGGRAFHTGGMGALSKQQIEFFKREGYLLVPEVFAVADLEPLRDEFTEVIHRTALELQAAGKLSRLYEEEPFERRLTCIFRESEEILGPIVGQGGGGHSGPALFAVITHPRLLAVVESLIGPEIVASSVYRVRPKIPGMARGVVPWHQDSGYFSPHCDRDLIVTCWIPLVDATVENGCLEVLPRAHRRGVVRHYANGPSGYLAIDDPDLPPVAAPRAVPVPLGGVLLLTNLTPHCSTPNHSGVVRWSLDLRYQDAAVPNNVGEAPQDFTWDRPDSAIACYPPEADFVVQSARNPDAAVRSAAEFNRLRQSYEHRRPPGPRRGWTPYDQRPDRRRQPVR